MRALRWFAALIGVVMFSVGSAGAQQGDAFRKGNEEYGAGRFREAVDAYQGDVRSGQLSAALFYNLGNACYRAGDMGHAILNYERALALEPHHPEAQANLRLVRDQARALELRRTAIERVVSKVTPAQCTLAAAVCFWLAAFAAAAWLLRRRRSPAVVALFIVSVAFCGCALAALNVSDNGSNGSALAIITGGKIEARLATADNAGTVLTLPTGSEIKILSTRGDWVYAALPNELRGWIPAQSAERVRL
ncbi:MAG: tetratricopeptide repeat protein [Chthoniobacterales bacterium]